MQIQFSALGGAVRRSWIQVVVNPKNPELGFGSIKVRALPQLHFDSLWLELVQAEATYKEKEYPEHAEALRFAQEQLIRAMVIGHEPKTFCAKFDPPKDENQKAELFEDLESMGFSKSEIETSFHSGEICKPFSSGKIFVVNGTEYVGASEEIVHFYRYCQPFGLFLIQLLQSLWAYQQGIVKTAEEIWAKHAFQQAPRDPA